MGYENLYGAVPSVNGAYNTYASAVKMNDLSYYNGNETEFNYNNIATPSIFTAQGYNPYSYGGDYTGGSTGSYGAYGGYGGYNGCRYPGSETQNMSLIDLDAYQSKRQMAQMENDIQLQKYSASADFKVNGSAKAVKNNVGFMAEALKENNQDEVSDLYDKLEESVKAKLADSGVEDPHKGIVRGVDGRTHAATAADIEAYDQKVKAEVADLYNQATGGQNMIGDLKKNASSPFWEGVVKGFDPLGLFTNKTTASENLHKMGGPEESSREKSTHTAGQVVGTVLMAGAALATAVLVGRFSKSIAKNGIKGAFAGIKSLFGGSAKVAGAAGKKSILTGKALTNKINELTEGLEAAKAANKGKLKTAETQKTVDMLTASLKRHQAMKLKEEQEALRGLAS